MPSPEADTLKSKLNIPKKEILDKTSVQGCEFVFPSGLLVLRVHYTILITFSKLQYPSN